MPPLPKLIAIIGPTASGKTKLAINLANKFNAEIISADSRQIYKVMNIGTNKNLAEYKNIPYHLINIKKPNEQFTLAEYQKIAIKKINAVIKKNKIPLLVGGTGLYISSILENYQIPTITPNKKIRQQLDKMTLAQKINKLKKLDPVSLNIVDLKNPRRLDRALEVCLTGQKFSALRQKNKPLYQTLILGIKTNKAKLTKKINQRVDLMLKQGLIDETKKIIKKYGKNSQPLSTIGYAEIINYLNKPSTTFSSYKKSKVVLGKKTTLKEAAELIKTHTRQYVKRQMTWFNKIQNINWINTPTQASKLIQDFLKK